MPARRRHGPQHCRSRTLNRLFSGQRGHSAFCRSRQKAGCPPVIARSRRRTSNGRCCPRRPRELKMSGTFSESKATPGIPGFDRSQTVFQPPITRMPRIQHGRLSVSIRGSIAWIRLERHGSGGRARDFRHRRDVTFSLQREFATPQLLFHTRAERKIVANGFL